MLLLIFQDASDGLLFSLREPISCSQLALFASERPQTDSGPQLRIFKQYGRHCPEISIAGESCVALRIARNLFTVYGQMALLSLTDTAFRVNDLVVAHDYGRTAVWHGLIRSIGRGSTRVVNEPDGCVHLDASQAARPDPWKNGERRLQWLATTI